MIKFNQKIISSLIFIGVTLILILISHFKDVSNFTYDFGDIKGVYLSDINDNLQTFIETEGFEITNKQINLTDKQSLLTDSVLSVHHYGVANENLKNVLKGKFYKTTGSRNNNLENIRYRKNSKSYIFYSYFSKHFKFKYPFDRDENFKYWGVDKDSNDLLYESIQINYYIDKNNYSVSIFDVDDNELVFVKDKNFKSYKSTWESFVENSKKYINKKRPIVGLDEFIFPVLKVPSKGSENNLKNIKINDDVVIQKYFIETNFLINGAGENTDKIPNKINFINSKDNIKYNFKNKSILFIRDKYEQEPFFAYKY